MRSGAAATGAGEAETSVGGEAGQIRRLRPLPLGVLVEEVRSHLGGCPGGSSLPGATPLAEGEPAQISSS